MYRFPLTLHEIKRVLAIKKREAGLRAGFLLGMGWWKTNAKDMNDTMTQTNYMTAISIKNGGRQYSMLSAALAVILDLVSVTVSINH